MLGLSAAHCSARCQYSGWEVNWSTAMQAHGFSGTPAAGSRISAAVKQASDIDNNPPDKQTLQNNGMAYQRIDGKAQHANINH